MNSADFFPKSACILIRQTFVMQNTSINNTLMESKSKDTKKQQVCSVFKYVGIGGIILQNCMLCDKSINLLFRPRTTKFILNKYSAFWLSSCSKKKLPKSIKLTYTANQSFGEHGGNSNWNYPRSSITFFLRMFFRFFSGASLASKSIVFNGTANKLIAHFFRSNSVKLNKLAI